jgi:hypothetical protein
VRPNVPEDGPIRPKHVETENVWYICTTNCVDGKIIIKNKIKTIKRQYISSSIEDAEE